MGDPMWIALRVVSRFDAILSLRNAEGRELDLQRGLLGRRPGAGAADVGALAPGTYYVVVDAAGADLTTAGIGSPWT
ncbi:MAG: hypothetical protein M5U28_46510 [Sandaracinaceae bacterium]|nr:hypothetical protein [Sandaracinaceae bacterium]